MFLGFFSIYFNIYHIGLDGCQYSVKKLTNLRRHVQGHTCEKICACPFCGPFSIAFFYLKVFLGTFFASVQKVLDHVSRRQEGKNNVYSLKIATALGESQLKCTYCQKLFKTRRLLNLHCKRHVQNHRCIICSIATNSLWELRRHVNTVHMKSRSHSCNECGRTFSQKSDLNRHLAKHFTDEAHKCEFCDKKYRWEKQLQQHMKIHSEVCLLIFRHNINLF